MILGTELNCKNVKILRFDQCRQLIVAKQAEGEEYVAISHTWGNNLVRLEGVNWKVPKWISEHTCQQLVEKYGRVWIDSICIKQNNKDDVKYQITSMHNVYKSARHVVVVLSGNWIYHVTAMRRVTELMLQLKLICNNDCTGYTCQYVGLLKHINKYTDVALSMEWAKRVWTLQETIISESLEFVGFNGDTLITDVANVSDFHEFIRAFDIISDTDSNVWVSRLFHSCYAKNVWEIQSKVSNLANTLRPIDMLWFADMNGNDARLTLDYTVSTVIHQLGHGCRSCAKTNDLIYGVAALLKIRVNAEYSDNFADVFYDAVFQLIAKETLVLPYRPVHQHGKTWLPCLKRIPPQNAWATIKPSCILSHEQDTYNILLIKHGLVYARGNLFEVFQPSIVHAPLALVEHGLVQIIKLVMTGAELTCYDGGLYSVLSVVLWMYTNCGNQVSVNEGCINSIIERLDTNTIKYSIEQSASAIRTHISMGYGIKETASYIMEAAGILFHDTNVYRQPTHEGRYVYVIGKPGKYLLAYTSHKHEDCKSYGIFYKRPYGADCNVHEKYCNVLTLNNGIWNNKGRANCWIVSNRWNYITGDYCMSSQIAQL